MQFGEVLDNGESQSESPKAPGDRTVRLVEAVEDMRENIGPDPRSRVGYGDLHVVIVRPTLTSTCPPLWVNFTAFESRFQTICWIRAGSPAIGWRSVFSVRRISMPFASASCLDRLNRIADDSDKIGALDLETKFSRYDAADIEQIGDQLRLYTRVPCDHIQAARHDSSDRRDGS